MKPANTVDYPDSSVTGKHHHRGYSLRATFQALRYNPCQEFPLLLRRVHPWASPFILGYLKRRGYSNCRVDVLEQGLLVSADR